LGKEFSAGEKAVQPLFQAVAEASQILARYPDGEAAIAWTKNNGGTSVFCGVPRLTTELLQFAAKKAGVHLFTEDGCVLYANGSFIVLHGTEEKAIRLDLGARKEVVDALTGTPIGSGRQLTIPLGFGETRILKTIP
jgi:hypothetical protein